MGRQPGWPALFVSRTLSNEAGPWVPESFDWIGMLIRCVQDEEGNYKLPRDEVTAIKQELIGLMISVPPNIQYQLGDAIGVIADSDFWERWDTLVDVRVRLHWLDRPKSNLYRIWYHA